MGSQGAGIKKLAVAVPDFSSHITALQVVF